MSTGTATPVKVIRHGSSIVPVPRTLTWPAPIDDSASSFCRIVVASASNAIKFVVSSFAVIVNVPRVAFVPTETVEPLVDVTTRAPGSSPSTVLNWMPMGDSICTMIYGSYELSLNLGSDFRRGTTYTVSVNDKMTAFVAQ